MKQSRTVKTRTRSASLPHASRSVKLRSVERRQRAPRVKNDPAAQDELRGEAAHFRRLEAAAERARRSMLLRAIELIRAEKLSKSEAARITGYTREYLTVLVGNVEKAKADGREPAEVIK
jgi:hypothetical protein